MPVPHWSHRHGGDMSETITTPAPAEGAGAQPVVSARDLTRRYGEGDTAVDALRGVSLDVRKGELTAVMGPSGSGKSTLMHILAGLDRPTSGEVTIAGTGLSALNDNDLTKLRRKHIGFVFQFFNLLPMLNAEENVVLPLSIAGEKPDKAWVDELLEQVGLTQRRQESTARVAEDAGRTSPPRPGGGPRPPGRNTRPRSEHQPTQKHPQRPHQSPRPQSEGGTPPTRRPRNVEAHPSPPWALA